MDPGSTWKTAWRLRLTVRPCFGRQVSFLFAFDGPAGSVAGRDRGVGGSTPARVVSAPGSRRGFLPVPGLAGGGSAWALWLAAAACGSGCFPGLWAASLASGLVSDRAERPSDSHSFAVLLDRQARDRLVRRSPAPPRAHRPRSSGLPVGSVPVVARGAAGGSGRGPGSSTLPVSLSVCLVPFCCQGGSRPWLPPPPSRLSSRLPAERLGVCVCPACLCAMHLCLLVRLGVCVFPSRVPAVASCGRVGFFARWVTGRGRGGEKTGEGAGVEGARAGCRSGAGTPRPRAVHSGGRGGVGAWCCCCFCSFRFSSAFASGSSRAVSFVWSFASCLSRLLRCVFSCPLSGAWCSPSHRRVGEGFLSLSLLLLFCAPRVLSIRVWARARPKQSAVRVFGEGPRAC